MMFRNGLKIIFRFSWEILFWVSLIVVSSLMMCRTLQANDADQVEVYFQGELQFSIHYEEFNLILKAAKLHSHLVDAEKNNRVVVELENNVWEIVDDKYKTKANVIWLDKENKPIKTMTLEIVLDKVEDEKQNYFIELYKKVSAIGLPIAIVLLLILL